VKATAIRAAASRRGALVMVVLALALMIHALLTPETRSAESADVVLTARIAPVFSLSILGPTTIEFGEVHIGAVYERPGATQLLVQSNRPWEFIDSSATEMVVAGQLFPRDPFLRHEVSLPFGTDLPVGKHLIECSYTLDLTPVEAFALPADAPLTATFGYTAIQK